MAETRQRFTAEIDASPEACFATVLDFPAYPAWSSVISSCSVRELAADGTPRVVEFELDMTIKTVRYVLEYRPEPPTTLEWTLVEGDVASVEGRYTFERKGRKTVATCEQAVDLGFWVPGPIRRVAEQKALKDSVLEFKAEVERRAKER
jgi:ribosome-associated toxin RatA of RatAB toxin-antitoxin module